MADAHPTSPTKREALMNAAVKFLQDPLVQKTSPSDRDTFLRSKGLSDDEIQLVLQRSAALQNAMMPPTNPSSVSLPPPVPDRNYNAINNTGNRSRFKNFINSLIFIFGSYGIYYFFKKYVHYILFGKEEADRKRIELDNILACSSSIDELRTIAKDIGDTLEILQDEQQRRPFAETSAISRQLQDLKAEIASVKALLLGRNQFPPPVFHTKLVTPSIPAWQLLPEKEETVQDCKDDTELEARTSGSGSSENVATNESDSSLEMISKNAD